MPAVIAAKTPFMLRAAASGSKNVRKHASKLANTIARPVSTTAATNGAKHPETSVTEHAPAEHTPARRRVSLSMSPFFASSPMSSMFRALEQDLDNMMGGFDLERPASSVLAVDVQETDSQYTITADLPGVAKEDVKVKVSPDNVLTISAERNDERDTSEGSFHRVERSYGSFARSFRLPEHVDVASITAKSADGVLTLTVPKLEHTNADKTVHVAVE